MKNKNNKGVTIALLIVIVVLIGSIVFMFVNTNNNNSSNNNSNSDENKVEEGGENLNNSDEIVQELYGYVNSNYFINSYFRSNESLTNKTITNDMKLKIALNINDSEIIGNFKSEGVKPDEFGINNDLYTISADEIVNKIDNIFRKDNGYKHITESLVVEYIQDGSFTCSLLSYNESTNNYEMIDSGCGYSIEYQIHNKLMDVNKTENTIVLTEKMYVTTENNDVYQDVDRTKIIESNVSEEKIDENEEFYEKGATVTYTFKLAEDGSYYFESSSIVYQ